jgi:hypothetical protein
VPIASPFDVAPLAGGTNDDLLALGDGAHEGPPFLDQGADRGLALVGRHAAPRRLDLGGIKSSDGRTLAARGKIGIRYAASSIGAVS